MDNELLNTLLHETFTKPSLIRRIREIRDFVSYRLYTYQKEGSLQEALTSYLAIQKSISPQQVTAESTWLGSLGVNFFQQFTPENFHEQIKALGKIADFVNTVIIYLPMELPELSLREIGLWLKKNVGPTTLFEVSYNPDLIGGCAFSYKGNFKDYSLKAQIGKRKAILDSLKSFNKV